MKEFSKDFIKKWWNKSENTVRVRLLTRPNSKIESWTNWTLWNDLDFENKRKRLRMEVNRLKNQTSDRIRTLRQSPDRTEAFKNLRNLMNRGIQKRHHLNGSHLQKNGKKRRRKQRKKNRRKRRRKRRKKMSRKEAGKGGERRIRRERKEGERHSAIGGQLSLSLSLSLSSSLGVYEVWRSFQPFLSDPFSQGEYSSCIPLKFLVIAWLID